MPGDWSTVAAAAVGALAGISGGAVVEMYKRRRDRRGTARALAAAIQASVKEVEQFKVVEALTGMAAALDKVPDSPFTAGKMLQKPPAKYNVMVFEKHIDRLGLLSPDLAARTILWFSSYTGFQHVLWSVIGECSTNKQASAMIRRLDEEWKEVRSAAPRLAADLIRSSRW